MSPLTSHLRLASLAVCAGLAATSCVTSDNDLSAKDQCSVLVSVLCDRTTECGRNISYFPNVRSEQDFADDCELELSRELCVGVEEVSYSFDDCLHALPKAQCSVSVLADGVQPGVKTPSSCEEVLLSR